MPLYNPLEQRYNFGPTDQSWLAWSYDHTLAGTANTLLPTAGRLEVVKVRLPVAASVTNIVMYLGTSGATLTAGQNFMALYTSAGALVGVTADQKTNWEAAAGLKTAALVSGPFTCAAGNYFVGMWYNGTTAPCPIRLNNVNWGNAGLSAGNYRWSTADTGLTTTAPPTMGAQTSSNIQWWVALS